MSSQTIRRGLKKAATSLLLIVILAVAARLAFTWDQERKIPSGVLGTVGFYQETGNIAYSLATGKGFSSPFRRETGPTAWLAPVYPLMVAGVFKVFGICTVPSFFVCVFLNIAFSAGVCMPIYYTVKRIAGIGVASGAAWLWALFPNAIMMPFEWIWDTSLAALLVATLLWASMTVAESRRFRDWCGYGILWGFALLTNPALGMLLPPLLGWAAYRAHKKGQARFGKSAVAFGLTMLCLLPWTIRNYLVFHRFIPLRSNLPLELYIGNNENYDDKRSAWPPLITKEREILRFFRMGEMAFMDEEWRKATQFIVTHPRAEALLTAKRFVAFWTGIPAPVDTFRDTDSLLIRGLLLGDTLAGIGALSGIVVLFRRRNVYAFPTASFPVFFPWLYYVTHDSLRYRHPIDPVVLLLVAVALEAAIGAALKARSTTRHLQEQLHTG